MTEFGNAWPLDTQDMDASLEAATDCRALRNQLQADDLPRFEGRFKELHNEHTICENACDCRSRGVRVVRGWRLHVHG